LVLGIEPAQRAPDIADIGRDAEIRHAPNVEGDSHRR
jgi:hypothetical protein